MNAVIAVFNFCCTEEKYMVDVWWDAYIFTATGLVHEPCRMAYTHAFEAEKRAMNILMAAI